MARASRSGKTFALAVLDLDEFKPINDRHGYAVGDALLVGLANRPRSSILKSDTVGRLGGDEFFLVLEGLGHPDQIEIPLRRLRSALAKPFSIQGLTIRAGASIGYCIWNGASDDGAEAMLLAADLEMYAHKSARKKRAG